MINTNRHENERNLDVKYNQKLPKVVFIMTLEEELKQCKENLQQYKKSIEDHRKRVDNLQNENTKLTQKIWLLENNEIKSLKNENGILKENLFHIKQEHSKQLANLRKRYEEELVKVRHLNRHEEVMSCLERNKGNKTKTAMELGISRQALYNYLEKVK